ncbi:polyprenyl diphosphate synthase, partial [Polymorphobacter multimanifer]
MTLAPAPLAAPVLGAADGGVRHLAIIMDGNGRWAQRRRLPRIAGHRAGVESVRRVVEAAPDLGIEVLTLYAFSSENWKRPADEVSDLMGLLRHYVRSEIKDLHRNGVRLEFIGNWRALKPDLVALLEEARALTVNNRKLTLVMALNYGGQDEVVRAARSLAADVASG